MKKPSDSQLTKKPSDSQLTALLDGELDPLASEVLQASIAQNPGHESTLADLDRVRRTVTDLSRPALPYDLATGVMDRIAGTVPEAPEVAAQESMPPPRVAFGSVTNPAMWTAGLAAALLLLAVVAFLPRGGSRPPIDEANRGPARVDEPPVIPAVRADVGALTRSDSENASANVTPPAGDSSTSVAAGERSVPIAPGILPIDRELDRLAAKRDEMLRQGTIRRVVLLVDQITPSNLEPIEKAISQTPRRHARHTEIRICQDIRIDPMHPDQAVVYVVALDSAELQNFTGALRRAFPDQDPRPRDEVDPAVVAQLSEIGQIAVVEMQPQGTLQPIPAHLLDPLANYTLREGGLSLEVRKELPRPRTPGQPKGIRPEERLAVVIPPKTAGDSSRRNVGSGSETADAKAPQPRESGKGSETPTTGDPDPPVTYLVWVTTRAKRS
jgi:anti-sigma factor RsiW